MFSPLKQPVETREANKLAWLRLARTENVGPITFYRLVDIYGTPAKALERLPDLARRGGKKKPLTAPALSEIEKEYEALKKIGGEIITAAEEFYPLALAATDDGPPVISVLGRKELLNESCIAIVGARNASVNGRKFAEKLARELGQHEMKVVSGLARGIDTAAHTGSLATGTIAVVAGGIDIVYPEENKKLYEQMGKEGLIVAESPFGQVPFAQSFPRRNRIVSGLSKGVIVVEATMRSGSLITARLAGEQGRDVYAVPGHPLDPRAEGPNHLIREGATLVRTAGDVLETLRSFSGQTLREPFAPALRLAESFTEEENLPANGQDIILNSLSFTPIAVDELVRTCNLSIPAIQTIVLELELAGRVKRHAATGLAFWNKDFRDLSASNIVIVESPAKAKTINKYLGSDYEVIASYGHVRDLVNKDGSVVPEDDFTMKWQLGERADKNVRDIKKAAKNASAIYLATDPDREGEAISWHVKEILQEDGLLKGKLVRRVTFNEITKKAVLAAFENARDLDEHLIEAYLARRALDYLVGFNLSPVLWRKLPGSRSAGRVQSVALRLICERETEIEKFNSQEYWSIEAKLHTQDGVPFMARLTHLAGNKLDKMDIGSQDAAQKAVDRIRLKSLSVQKIEKKQVRRNPAPPFITSSLQMEAARKLRLTAAQTMRLAQRLYEGIEIDGESVALITYMRTDGTTLSEEAVTQSRHVIAQNYGDPYLPPSPRLYKSKAKNAQEAHEAIRPTDLSRLPNSLRGKMDEDQFRLYELIWKRTIASQMENAVMDQMSIDISDGTDDVILRANGSVVTFDGFLTLYAEDQDDEDTEDESNRRLPPMNEGEKTKLADITPHQHFTQPPPRYSEATLVKKLEELGIGRPSTYASILQVLRDRKYVQFEKRRFIPEDRGRLVTTFLSKFFARYVDYDFTANLEEELDAIAGGHVMWKEALRQFWKDFKAAVDETKDLTITQVIDHLDAELGAHFFHATPENPEPRKCQACGTGALGLKLGKFGAFVGCSNYPECKYTRPLVIPAGEEGEESRDAAALSNEPKILGTDPGTGRTVSLRRGPYGPYVQIDPAPESRNTESEYKQALSEWEKTKTANKAEGKKAPPKPKKPAAPKPKRQSIPKGTPIDEVTLEAALRLLALPREVGRHPETGELIEAGIGRFGPYLKHAGKFTSLPKDDDVLTVGMNRAVEVLAVAAERAAKRPPGKGRFAKKQEEKKPEKKKPAAKKKKPSAQKKSAATS